MNKKLFAIPAVILAMVISVGVSTQASAESIWAHLGIGVQQGDSQGQQQNDNDHTQTRIGVGMNIHAEGDMKNRGVFGTVTAISGNTITLQNKGFGANPTVVTYTVDATNASILKNNTTITTSGIALGDTLIVQGTVNGTAVTATKIQDGFAPKPAPKKGPGPVVSLLSNGQPVIGGKVTAISGNTITITNSSNVSYTIDATNAKITKNGATAAVSTITVGDQLLAQGTINGTAVTATTVIDGTATTNNASAEGEAHGNFFGQIGAFFKHIFGF
jgi:hypothetical protein